MHALRAIPAGMLAAAAAVLGGASKLAELGARRLAPRSEAPEPRHPSFLDTSEPADRPFAGGTLYDAEADAQTGADSPAEAARVDVADLITEDLVTTEDLVGAADLAAELDITDPLVADSELGDVAGDTVVADDAIEAMVAHAMTGAIEVDPVVADVDLGADPALALPLEASGEGTSPAATLRTDTGPAVPVDDDDAAADVPSLDEAVLGDDGEARTYESHIAELADRNVASVVREIQDLSTEELGQLFEYESAHRKRKTVLQAIERATAPDEDAART